MATTASPRAAQSAASPAAAAPPGERSPFARTAELLAPYQPGLPLITLSLGEPQHPIPGFVGPVLSNHINDFGRYPVAKGIEPFRRAAATWLGTRFSLPRPVDPETEVLVLNGSREGLFFAAIAAARYVPPRKGTQALNTMMSHLHGIQATPTHSDYVAAAQAVLRRHHKRSLIIVITNFRDEDSTELHHALRLLRSRHLVLLASVRERVVDEMIGQPLERVISSALLHYLSSESWIELAKVFHDGTRGAKHEADLHCAGHRVLPVNLTASRLPLENQDVMCLVVTDLTMQKEQGELQLAKELAEKANVAKDAFLAALSHELRTPLTPVLLAVGALENDRNFPTVLRQQFSMMRRNVELEARLIDDLLDLTRIARGKLELQTGDVDFRDVLTLAIDICRPEIEAKRQRLEVKFDATETKTVGDGVRLQQAIWNLIRNASEAMAA